MFVRGFGVQVCAYDAVINKNIDVKAWDGCGHE